MVLVYLWNVTPFRSFVNKILTETGAFKQIVSSATNAAISGFFSNHRVIFVKYQTSIFPDRTQIE